MAKKNKNQTLIIVLTAVGIAMVGIVAYALLGKKEKDNVTKEEGDEPPSPTVPPIESAADSTSIGGEPWRRWVDTRFNNRNTGNLASQGVWVKAKSIMNNSEWLTALEPAASHEGFEMPEYVIRTAIVQAIASCGVYPKEGKGDTVLTHYNTAAHYVAQSDCSHYDYGLDDGGRGRVSLFQRATRIFQ